MKTASPRFVRALAQGDFSSLVNRFADAGLAVRVPVRGVMQIRLPQLVPARARLLLSAGVHGDETAPIEILAMLLEALAESPRDLVPDLMVVIGNPDAVERGRRFVDADLNRMFRASRSELAGTTEAGRADAIMRATSSFFGDSGDGRWHLDLHTAIRPSLYPTFGLVPKAVCASRTGELLGWMGAAGIGAAILDPKSAGTYSAWSAEHCGAASATIELGQVGAIGENDLRGLEAAYRALDVFLRTGKPAAGPTRPQAFRFAQELVKHSDAFRMAFDRDTPNFTALEPGQVIAEDGDVVYRVGAITEYVVFPNPDVRIGLRAGLTVVRAGG